MNVYTNMFMLFFPLTPGHASPPAVTFGPNMCLQTNELWHQLSLTPHREQKVFFLNVIISLKIMI